MDAGNRVSSAAPRGGWLAYTVRSRTRAAFADLGHAGAVLALVLVVTALKFSAYALPGVSLAAEAQVFALEVAALVGTLALAVPLLVAASNLAPAAGRLRLAWLVLATLLAVLACIASPMPSLIGVHFQPYQVPQLAVLVVLLVVVFEFRHRALKTAGALMRAEIDRITADTRLRDASLRMLQAQVAPHFLFNTLATVRRLARIDRVPATAMLGDLIQYFSGTLTRRDEPHTSLGEEAELVDAYLRIHCVRMGTRLAYEVDVPANLAHMRVPSMMLLTLVENAIKHGINPLVEGGYMRMRAERRGNALRIEVADNGRGMAGVEGHGSGLANVRARLSMLHGSRAARCWSTGNRAASLRAFCCRSKAGTMSVLATATKFARDVLRTFTWQKLLLAQLLAGALDLIAVLLFVRPFDPPPTFPWSRVVIEETMAFSILFAVLIADQAMARGARQFRAYALAIIVASIAASLIAVPDSRLARHVHVDATSPASRSRGTAHCKWCTPRATR